MTLQSIINNKYTRKIIPPLLYDIVDFVRRDKNNNVDDYKGYILQKNNALKGIYKNKRCFIVATGPSISNLNLEVLKDEHCIFTSRGYLHECYNVIKPQFHVFSPVTFHSKKVQDLAGEWFVEIEKRVDKNTTLLLGYADYEIIKQGNFFANHVKYFADYARPVEELKDKGLDFTKSVTGGQSISIMALLWAIYMGFTEIYLLGIDHNWIINHLNDVYVNKHFYNEEDCVLEKQFLKNYKHSNLEEIFTSNGVLWKQYRFINEYAKVNHIRIFNATEDSLLDVLPFKNFNSIF